VADAQIKALRAEAVLRLLAAERAAGLQPDLIIGHTGWGELLAIRQLFPQTPILGYQEFFYHLHGADINYDPEFTNNHPSEPGRIAFKTSTQFLDLATIDWGLAAVESVPAIDALPPVGDPRRHRLRPDQAGPGGHPAHQAGRAHPSARR
jgi:hypothetical protein